ncbi:transcription factor [Ancistrocladus abbreviatus]
MMDYRENLQKCQEYIQALVEERRKILVFQRELPLCLELVTQALEACRQQLSGTTTECLNGQSECSEQTTSGGPIFEEFIPLKRASSITDEEELESHEPIITETQNIDKSGKKSDWLRSVQLWNQNPDPPTPKQDDQAKKVPVVEVKKNGGAFHPFQKEKAVGSKPTSVATAATPGPGPGPGPAPGPTPAASACSTAETVAAAAPSGSSSKKDDKEKQSQRKARRCWSPELHRRFLSALQQLGGSHVATPKQIRELMKVDGLTNDEVKSHLQKYRLHTRRPTPAIHSNSNPQAPQFVVGIWVPPGDYGAVTTGATLGEAATAAPPKGVYAPVAAPPRPQASAVSTQRQQQKQSSEPHGEEQGSRSDGVVHCNSPSTSSSTHTSSASPAL